LTDEEMVIAFQQSGDKKWVGELYERYAHLVLGVCLKYIGEKEKAKDAAMDIFHSLYDKLMTIEVLHFRAWLYTISKNFCLMQLRKKDLNVSLDHLNLQASYEETLEVKQLTEHKLELLEEAITLLNPEQALCLRQFYLNKKCYKTIATEQNMDLKKVKSHIQNGKRMLLVHLSNYPEFK
jgi:RNA polymerase sigma-70 factor (ECF subfamily)